MDILLLHVVVKMVKLNVRKSFNPCFNGYTTFTLYLNYLHHFLIFGFNPCFNGYTTFTRTFAKILYL